MTIQDIPPYFIQSVTPIQNSKNETSPDKSFDDILKEESEKYNERVTKKLNIRK